VNVTVANTLSAVAIEGTAASFTTAPAAATNPALNSRSEVHAITLSFSANVNPGTTGSGALNPANYTLSASPYVFTQAGAVPFTPPTPLATIVPSPGPSASQVVLTFTGNTDFGSLKDGDYQLVVSGLTDSGGFAITGATVNFRRLFGDANGNGRLDFADFSGIYFAQGSRVGDAAYNPAFDFDFDGDVDVSDQLAFFTGSRFARSSAAPPTQYPPVA
jgi:hypothetical protein